MEQVRIRVCTHEDIDAILQLDRQWEQEQIAYAFMPISRKEFLAHLERFPLYFLVAECDAGLVGHLNGSVHQGKGVAMIPEGELYVEIVNVYVQPASDTDILAACCWTGCAQ